jgi:predicted ATPase
MMIQALSIPESPTRSTMASICDWLHHRRILLIIDNCEQVITAVADFVAQLLRAAAQLTILATSRIPLRLSAEYEYAVDTLGLPDPSHLPSLEQFRQYNAVALFVTRARAVRADFAITTTNAPAVAEICVRLDGLPLAIELAAARIRFFSPEQLLSRLMTARMQTLIGGARDLPTRQQTMRATIDWSYRLLNTHEQDLFARLAVFVGGWTLEAAATIGDFRLSIAAIGEPGGDAHRATDMHADTISNLPIDIVNLLDALVEHSLVRLQETDSEPRYTMLETLHEYALEQLQERGEESLLRERHAAYFVTFAEAIEQQRMQGSDSWRTRFHPEQANLDAVIAWSCRIADDQRIGIRLAQALDQYCKQEGQHQRAYQYLIQLSNAYTNRATVDQMRLLGLQGHKLFDLDQYRRALAAYDQACPWLIANGYPQEACERLEEASRCARNLQDLDRAYALAEQSRKLIEQYDIEAQSGWNAMSFGDIATDHGDFDQAERFYNEGLQKSEAHHNSYAAGCALMARARMWQAANHPEQAMADYQAALRIHRTIAPGMAQVELLEISWLQYDQGRHEPLSDLIRENMMITSDHKNHNVLLLVGYLNVAHHPQRATRLLSAFAMAEQRLLGEISPFPAELQQQFDTQLQRLREQLGDTAFEAAWAVGQSFAWKHILADIVAWLDDADTINV